MEHWLEDNIGYLLHHEWHSNCSDVFGIFGMKRNGMKAMLKKGENPFMVLLFQNELYGFVFLIQFGRMWCIIPKNIDVEMCSKYFKIFRHTYVFRIASHRIYCISTWISLILSRMQRTWWINDRLWTQQLFVWVCCWKSDIHTTIWRHEKNLWNSCCERQRHIELHCNEHQESEEFVEYLAYVTQR